MRYVIKRKRREEKKEDERRKRKTKEWRDILTIFWQNLINQFEWVLSSGVHIVGYGQNVPRVILLPSVTKSLPETENISLTYSKTSHVFSSSSGSCFITKFGNNFDCDQVSFDTVHEVFSTAMRVNFQALAKFTEDMSALGDQLKRLAKHYLILVVSFSILYVVIELTCFACLHE